MRWIFYVIAALIVLWCVYSFIRAWRNRRNCCNCGKCSGCSAQSGEKCGKHVKK
ncbi:MAG: FeoB-associated Cys-rich membrane protein [Christensenellales bacterium]